MKANKIQQYLCDVICSQQDFWKHSNDITSPTHLNDIEEECYSQLCNLISDEDREEFEDKLKDLYWFIRKLVMKANAPEKLYLDATSKCGDTVFTIKNNDTDIEYTRTDAFIEKAARFLEYKLDDRVEIRIAGTLIPSLTSKKAFIEEFSNFMKGE